MSAFQKITQSLLYQLHPLPFGRNRVEDLRMLCLGHAQIKISMELLATGIIMRMVHTGICLICDSISFFSHIACIDHIFIKNGPIHKSTHFFVNLLVVSCTYIRAKICLDPVYACILLPFYRRNRWIIKRSGIAFYKAAVLFGQLSCVCCPHLFICFKRL